MTPRDYGKQCTGNHSVPREVLMLIKGFTLTTFVYLSFMFVRHNKLEIDTSISVIMASPTTCEAQDSPWLHLGPWWVSQFVDEATKTPVLVSLHISIPELKLIHASKRGHWWHYPDSKVRWAIMGPHVGPHVGPMNFAILLVSVNELFQHWFKWWFGSCSATNEHTVNQWPTIYNLLDAWQQNYVKYK